MVDCTRILLLSLLIALGLSPPLRAEPPLPADVDAQVEQGIAAYDAGDYKTAKAILLPLAEANNPRAMVMIGLMHGGTPVFPNNPKTECDWYERAAHLGNDAGMYNLSICYNHGIGREQNHDKMLKWRSKGARNGSTLAMINMAALDPSEGEEYRHWMLMAQDHGSAYAKVSLWLQGYKSDSQMNLIDFICVSWRVLIMDGSKQACD